MSPRAEKSREGVPFRLLQTRARSRVRSQVKAGLMVKPERCERCGVNPGFGRDGRSLLQGHHHKGYDFPTDVEWLCARCHSTESPPTPQLGEANPQSKLTEAAVREIRASTGTKRSLAARYGVDPELIRLVRRRKLWGHVQ